MDEQISHPIKILLADDDPGHRLLIRKSLQRGSGRFDIEEAENGAGCLEKIRSAKFELVLLDYSLPDASGLDVLAVIRKEHEGIPVIMITGQGNEQVVREAIRLGASDYILKGPEFLDHLFSVVERTLSQQALKSQLDRSKGELLKRSEELTTLLEATTAVTSQLNLDRVLAILSERIGQAVSCTFVKILLLDEGGGLLVVKAAHPAPNFEWDPALGHSFEILPGSFVLSVIADHAPILLREEQIRDLNADRALKLGLIGNLEQIQSVLIVPVIMKDECLGVVVLGERRQWERMPFTIEKSGLAMALVQHASIAIKNAHLYQSLQKANLQIIIGLAEALETRDAYTRGHSDRAVEFAGAVSQELGLTLEQADGLQYAAILHDIGKIGIPDNILNKPGKLTEEEFGLMKTHPVKGANILSKIPFLARMAPMVRHHHERWDGTGYPDGIAGEDIPIESRIVAVLDSYDAMTSDRIYRKAPGIEYAQDELRRCAGTKYDSRVVAAFLKVVNLSSASKKQESSDTVQAI
jgi:response regulator RpfG family c-di-GMP phosphodiesterase